MQKENRMPKSDPKPRAEVAGGSLESMGTLVEKGILYVGVDLGTSRSAIACSNGVRECVSSVVGWPRDSVAAKLRGDAPIVGDPVLEHRLSLDVVFPLADGNLRYIDVNGNERDRYRRAGLVLLEHLMRLAGARKDQLIYAVIGAPAEASQANKQAILDLAKEAGIDSVMVVSEPFAVAYGIDVLEDALIVDIGAGTMDLCRLHGTLPEAEDQVTISKAGNFVDEELAKLIQKRHPKAQFTLQMVKKAKERFSGVVESSDRALVTFPVQGVPTAIDLSDEVQQAVRLLVPEILAGIQRLVASFDPEFQHRLRNRVIVSGGGSLIFGLEKALEDGMQAIGGGHVSLVDEPIYAGANGALKMAREMPTGYWEKLQR